MRHPGATVADTVDAVAEVYSLDDPPPARCYQGEWQLAKTEAVMGERMARERQGFRKLLAELMAESLEMRAAGTLMESTSPESVARTSRRCHKTRTERPKPPREPPTHHRKAAVPLSQGPTLQR